MCFAIIAALFAQMLLHPKEAPDMKIKNVTVNGISLQGLTPEEAIQVLNQYATELLPKEEIVVKILDSTLVLTNEDTNAQLDISAMATAAYLHGRDNRTDGTKPLVLNPNDFVNLEASKIRPLLINFVQPFNGRPIETSVTISGDRPDLTKEPEEGESDQVLTITVGYPKYLCDPETLFRTILRAHKNRQLLIVGTTILIEPEAVSAAEIFYQHCVSPINATIDPDTHIITESVYGYGFDIQKFQLELNKADWGGILSRFLFPV
ncbi:MAG: hypothetical protein E7435_05030 [Ruminococcaceae bacterium]|nr:hypothetical protein [Oscillospiraceae bacterium]